MLSTAEKRGEQRHGKERKRKKDRGGHAYLTSVASGLAVVRLRGALNSGRQPRAECRTLPTGAATSLIVNLSAVRRLVFEGLLDGSRGGRGLNARRDADGELHLSLRTQHVASSGDGWEAVGTSVGDGGAPGLVEEQLDVAVVHGLGGGDEGELGIAEQGDVSIM